MSTNNDWMSGTLGGKALMFQAITDNLAAVQVELGMTNDQRERALNMAAEFLNAYNYRAQATAWDDAVGTWFTQMMNGDGDGNTGDPLPAPPPAPVFVETAGSIYGVIKEFRRERELWLTLPGWSKSIGELLLVIKPESNSLNPSEISPTLKAVAAQSGYEVAVIVGDRGGTDLWDLEGRRKGGDWFLLGTFNGKGVSVGITPTTPGEPEQLDLRARCKKNNQPVGNYSETRTVTVSP